MVSGNMQAACLKDFISVSVEVDCTFCKFAKAPAMLAIMAPLMITQKLSMKIRLATKEDVAQILALEQAHLHDELGSSAISMQGQAFGRGEILELVSHHSLVVAEADDNIVGYVMAADWSFYGKWPLYRGLLKRLKEFDWDGTVLNERNSCQYGPIWIRREYRGQGIFEALVAEVRRQTRPKYLCMLAFIAEDNQVSYKAHTGKGQMQVVDYYSFDERDYYVLLG
jgi:L-amino acid N-acyltransferase YncA